MTGTEGKKYQLDAIMKKIKVVEKKLTQQLSRYNEAHAANRQTRDQIDFVRRERINNQQIHKKLAKEL